MNVGLKVALMTRMTFDGIFRCVPIHASEMEQVRHPASLNSPLWDHEEHLGSTAHFSTARQCSKIKQSAQTPRRAGVPRAAVLSGQCMRPAQMPRSGHRKLRSVWATQWHPPEAHNAADSDPGPGPSQWDWAEPGAVVCSTALSKLDPRVAEIGGPGRG